MRDAATGERGPARDADQVLNVQGTHDTRRIQRNILEQLAVVDVLLRIGVDQIMKRQTRDGDDRRAIGLGIIKAVQQMSAAGPRRSKTAAEPAGCLGVGTCHEGRRLLMTDLDKAYFVV